MYRIDHHAIPRRLRGGRRGCNAIRGVQKSLVITRIVLLMEPGGKPEIGQLDVAILVNQNVIRFDISTSQMIAWAVSGIRAIKRLG